MPCAAQNAAMAVLGPVIEHRVLQLDASRSARRSRRSRARRGVSKLVMPMSAILPAACSSFSQLHRLHVAGHAVVPPVELHEVQPLLAEARERGVDDLLHVARACRRGSDSRSGTSLVDTRSSPRVLRMAAAEIADQLLDADVVVGAVEERDAGLDEGAHVLDRARRGRRARRAARRAASCPWRCARRVSPSPRSAVSGSVMAGDVTLANHGAKIHLQRIALGSHRRLRARGGGRQLGVRLRNGRLRRAHEQLRRDHCRAGGAGVRHHRARGARGGRDAGRRGAGAASTSPTRATSRRSRRSSSARLGKSRAANTTVCARLVVPEAKVEIEVTRAQTATCAYFGSRQAPDSSTSRSRATAFHTSSWLSASGDRPKRIESGLRNELTTPCSTSASHTAPAPGWLKATCPPRSS